MVDTIFVSDGGKVYLAIFGEKCVDERLSVFHNVCCAG